MHLPAEANDNPARPYRTGPLCWAARLLALGYGLFIALYALGAWVLVLIGNVSRGQTEEGVIDLLRWLPFFIPFILAIVAWKRHLIGGTLITAFSAAVYLYFTILGDMQWGVHLYMVPLLTGGLLHLLVWHKEKKSERVPQPT